MPRDISLPDFIKLIQQNNDQLQQLSTQSKPENIEVFQKPGESREDAIRRSALKKIGEKMHLWPMSNLNEHSED